MSEVGQSPQSDATSLTAAPPSNRRSDSARLRLDFDEQGDALTRAETQVVCVASRRGGVRSRATVA
eukprot:6694287-Prymnesium_polylepis.1